MQTSREVISDLLRGRKPERVGLVDYPWVDTIAAWVEQGYPTRMVYKEVGQRRWRREDGRSVEVEVAGEYEEPLPDWEHFGFDMARTGPDIDIMPLVDHSELLEETEVWAIRRNGGGAALKYWKHKSGTPEHMDFLMTTREIWERDYRPHLLDLNPDRIDLEVRREDRALASATQKWTYFLTIFVWELMRQSMGDVTLYQSVLLDPDWVHDYNRVYTDLFKAHYAYLFDKIGAPDGMRVGDDLGYKGGLFASPRVLGDLIFPYYKELVDFFHSYDVPVELHSCGSTAAAMPLILEAGFDALHPMERKAKDNDPFVFAEKYGDRIAFVGGLDARVFETNDKEIIRREVTDYMVGMKARGARFVFSSDHSVSTNTRYESYRYAVDVYREHMMY